MEDFVRQRVISVLNKYNINPSQFSGEDKAMQKRLSRQLKCGSSVTCETLLSILDRFNDISAEWLLRGIGEMEKQSSEIVSGDNLNTNDMELKTLLDVIRRQNARLDELEKEIAYLRSKYEPLEERPAV